MKKIYFVCIFVIFSLSTVFADLHPTRRFFEVSVDADVGVSNNAIQLRDYLTEKVVISLKDFSDELSDKDFNFNTNVSTEEKISFNTKKLKFAVFSKTDGVVNIDIDRNLFSYLVKGNYGTYSKDFKINAYGSIYENVGISIFSKIHGLGLTLTPTLYLPVLYIPEDPINISVETTGDGMKAKFSADLNIYSAVSLEDPLGTLDVVELVKNAGFLLSFGLERRITDSLELGGYASVPLSAGKLSYLRQQKMSWDMSLNNLISTLDGEEVSEFESDFSEPVYSQVEKELYHPLSFGLEAAWKPFGSWFAVNGLIGLKVMEPYNPDYRKFFPEYDVGATLTLLKILGFSVDSAYKDQIFLQSASLMVNLRLVELDLRVSLQGRDFLNSFRLSGLGAYVGVKVGF